MTIVLDDETPKDFKPLIESSIYRSYQEYVKAGLENEKDRDRSDRPVIEQYNREMRFLTAVNLDKGPLIRKITKMIRFKDKGQEYLTFTEDWRAKNWVGIDIDPVIERMEGILVSPNMIPEINEQGQRIGRRKQGFTKKYEIPFNKENVDKWLEETKTPRDEVIYTVNGPNALSGECVVYEQFIYPWNKAVDILMKDGGFQSDYMDGLKKK
jgi:hypothetical protein